MKDEDITTQGNEAEPLRDEQLEDVAGGSRVKHDSHWLKRHQRLQKLREQNQQPEEQGILWNKDLSKYDDEDDE